MRSPGVACAATTLALLAGCAPASGVNTSAPHQRSVPGLVASISVGKDSAAMAVGEGFVWTPNTADGTVSKVDPRTNRVVDTITVGSRANLLRGACAPSDVHQAPYGSAALRACDLPSGLATGEGSLWVTGNDTNSLLRIDPRSDRVVATIPLGSRPFDVAVGSGMVWVSDFYADGLWRIDPSSNAVVAHLTGLAHGPSTIRIGAGGVWVANARDGMVTRIDPGANTVVATIPTGRRPLAMALTDYLWVRDDFDLTLTKIDPAQGLVVDVITIGPRDPTIDYVDSIAADAGSVWVSGMRLQRVDARTDRVVLTIDQDADTVALGFGSVWVSDIFGILHRLRPGA